MITILSSMEIPIRYGEKEIAVEIPSKNIIWELSPNDLPAVADEHKAVADAVSNPINSERLSKLIKPHMNVVIIADDFTRSTPKKVILPIILDELNCAGVSDEKVTVLIGLGTHRYMTEEEIVKNFGSEVVSRVRVVNHEWMDPQNLVYIGTTSNGTPVTINRMAYEADFLIGVGSIVPHCWAGFSGGAKIVQPGICGPETTAATHYLIFDDDDRVLDYAGMPRNKVMQEMRAVALKAGLRFIVNAVINSRGQLVKVVAGDPIIAHDAGIEISKRIFVRNVEEKADIVIVEAYPADLDMWQATKPLSYSRRVVKDGGTVIFVTAAPDGLSPTHPLLAEKGQHTYQELKQIMKCDLIDDKVAGSLLMLIKKGVEGVNVLVVSEGLTREMKQKMNMGHADSVEDALKLALERHGRDATVGIIHHGGDVLPVLKERGRVS
ncbi:MAG: nickel-dependent lactate racemase [Methanomassiliicoccales archaeon]|nr:nickel-dependent lactate racemase [Methanomassiliicoccales archaeon]